MAHSTVCPTFAFTVPGLNARFLIVTGVVLPDAAALPLGAVLLELEFAALELVALELLAFELDPQPDSARTSKATADSSRRFISRSLPI